MKELDCEYMVDENGRACRSTGKLQKRNVVVQEYFVGHDQIGNHPQGPGSYVDLQIILGKGFKAQNSVVSWQIQKEHSRPNTYMPLQVVRWR